MSDREEWLDLIDACIRGDSYMNNSELIHLREFIAASTPAPEGEAIPGEWYAKRIDTGAHVLYPHDHHAKTWAATAYRRDWEGSLAAPTPAPEGGEAQQIASGILQSALEDSESDWEAAMRAAIAVLDGERN